MSKFGEWECWSAWESWNDEKFHLCWYVTEIGTQTYIAKTDNESDAKLIAAAPKMYRLLNEAFLAMAEADIDEPLRLEIDECLCHITGEKCPTDEEE